MQRVLSGAGVACGLAAFVISVAAGINGIHPVLISVASGVLFVARGLSSWEKRRFGKPE
jgi:hypothetical protein